MRVQYNIFHLSGGWKKTPFLNIRTLLLDITVSRNDLNRKYFNSSHSTLSNAKEFKFCDKKCSIKKKKINVESAIIGKSI